MNINQWPKHERPRERLLNNGANNLTDTELLAIFIRCGIKGKTAIDLARELLQRFGNIKALLDLDQKTFCQLCGMGPAKYAQIQASLEIAKRYTVQTINTCNVMEDVESAKRYCAMQLGLHQREVFAVMCLNSNYHIIDYTELFFGTINRAIVHPREILRLALKHNASALIVTHNHLSGKAEPSKEDIHLTKHLKRTLELIDIHLVDHIIVGLGETYSFAENNLRKL